MKTILTAAAMASIAVANAQAIYEPTKSAEDQGMSLVGWGSGTIAQADEIVYEGGNSIRVSSRNFFQGGKIIFSNPVNLSSQFGQKDNLIKFNLNIPGASSQITQGGAARTGGGGEGSSGASGISGIGGEGEGGSPRSNQASLPATKVRIVFTTTDGKHGEAYLDITTSLKDENGWMSVGIPLQAISGLDKTNKIIKSMAISTDNTATLYLGGASVFRDSTPVFAEPNVRELNLAFGDEFIFSAAGSAGATPIKFQWDFDSTDGISIDAEGQSVRRKFRRDGTFTVTLTAVDVYGLKEPYRTTILVTVNP